jgi:hypothetical protein
VSGALHGPLIAPDKAAQLLDDVLYERVLGCVDLAALFTVEFDLWVALSEQEPDASDEHTRRLAKEMIDRALVRLVHEDRRYAMVRPFGAECGLCEDELHDSAKQQRRRKRG